MAAIHLMFAGDIHVFGHSISGLPHFVHICRVSAAEHEIIFNCKKTITF